MNSSMLHVCHLISGDLWAGAEVMACSLLNELQTEQDLELTVILLNHGRLEQELKKAGLEVHVIDENKHGFLQIFQAVRRILSARPPNIIHAHRYKENLLAFLVSRVLPPLKLISTQHGLPEIHGRGDSPKEKIKSSLNFFIMKRCFHKVVGVSRDIRSFFIDSQGFPGQRLEVIHNGVQISGVVVAKPDKGSFVIGSSGRLFPVKDYSLMIEVARVLCRDQEICFVLAGAGPERDKLENTIVQSGLDRRFILRGHVDDMDSFYQELDLFMNTSVHEGIPMTILEAMARGLPVIAPRVGGIPEVVQDGIEGFLIEGRDPQAFAEKCLLLHRDRELWGRMSRAAKSRVVRDFSVERMTEDYVRVYRGL